MKNIENYPRNLEEEHIIAQRDMERSRILKEKDGTKEGQAQMKRQLEEYLETIKNFKTDISSVKPVPEKNNKDFWEEAADFIKNERCIPVSKRTIEAVAAAYDFTPEEFKKILRNKKVLDIGSGESRLSEEAKENNINADIISLDFNKEALVKSGTDSSVLGTGEKIPFSSEKFDLVTAIYSIPYWANSAKSVENFMRESLRVTKKGGDVYISPITDILNRPSIKKNDLSDISELPKECDWEVQEALKSMQIRFIEILKELEEKGVVKIMFGKNFFHEMKYLNPEKIDSNAPTIAFIKKLK